MNPAQAEEWCCLHASGGLDCARKKPMISRSSGEVTFIDLRLLPHAVAATAEARRIRALPIPGWFHHFLGVHDSDRGAFDVEAVCDAEHRIQIVLLAHQHPFYKANTPEDSERHAYHEGVIASDLAGQREFSWGQIFCRRDPESNNDWLVLAYTPGPQVPMQSSAVLSLLSAHDPEPREG
jgi:hypothetical protein